MVDARSARFQGQVPGSWGTPAPAPARVNTSTLAGVQAASRPAPPPPPRPAPPPPPPAPRRTQMRQTEPPVEQKNFLRQLAPFLGVKEYAPGDSYWDKVSKNFASNPMNPVPQTWNAISEGRSPTREEVGTDAALTIGSALIGPAGRPAANALPQGFLSGKNRPAIETNQAIQARRDAIMRLLDRDGPYAINEYLKFPKTAYTRNIHQGTLENFFKNTSERIPGGFQLYRVPNSDEVLNLLPRTPGSVYNPGVVRSTGGSSDLNRLGQIINPRNVFDTTGGNQHYAPGIANITVMDDIPGILNINEFLSKYPFLKDTSRGGLGVSEFNLESLFGPQTSYYVRDFLPAVGDQPPTWYLNAFKR